MNRGSTSDEQNQTQTTDDNDKGASRSPEADKPIAISDARDFDPFSSDQSEKPSEIPNVYDDDLSTYWETDYYLSSDFGNLKSGVGVVLDLGEAQRVGKVTVTFVGSTSVELRSASPDADSEPTSFDAYSKVAGGKGTTVELKPDEALESRYLLVWLTDLPLQSDGQWRGRLAD
ncbi:serine/threonine protein kinase, partial [Streptomyces sp. TRM76130]|nr:serine/threonine protein kinase [Streptomyces sp. TRM76130]